MRVVFDAFPAVYKFEMLKIATSESAAGEFMLLQVMNKNWTFL